MFIPNDYLMLCLYKQIMRDRFHEAETYRLLRMYSQEKPGWFTRHTWRLLSCLGRLMLIWGVRLQSYSSGAGNPLKASEVARLRSLAEHTD